jgi:hypothetical protein
MKEGSIQKEWKGQSKQTTNGSNVNERRKQLERKEGLVKEDYR